MMPPVVTEMMRTTLEKKAKDWKNWEHISDTHDGSIASEAHNDDHELDFASHGQARLLNPTFYMRHVSPAAFEALVC